MVEVFAALSIFGAAVWYALAKLKNSNNVGPFVGAETEVVAFENLPVKEQNELLNQLGNEERPNA